MYLYPQVPSKQYACAMLSSVACPYNSLLNYLENGKIFGGGGGKFIEHKRRVLISSTSFALNICHFTKELSEI